jgi:zona occludens toxin (predicted ATPase)
VDGNSSNLSQPEQEAHSPPPAGRSSGALLPVVLFFLGVLVGVLGFLLYGILSNDPLLVRNLGQQGVDVAQVRDAARLGTLDAIATLQAGGSPQNTPTPAATPTELPKNAFALRDANTLGNASAPVTLIEYSDFQ